MTANCWPASAACGHFRKIREAPLCEAGAESAPMSPRHSKLIERACRRLEAAAPEPDLAALAAEAGLSRWHFQRLFTAATGISPKRYAMAQRQRRLEAALRAAPSVTDAIFDAGYAASSGAYRDLVHHGLKPGQLHDGGSGELIHYASAASSLGQVLVAASERGICMVEFGEPAATMSRLQQRFPNARLGAASRQLRDWIRIVVALIDDPRRGADLPRLDSGTRITDYCSNRIRSSRVNPH